MKISFFSFFKKVEQVYIRYRLYSFLFMILMAVVTIVFSTEIFSSVISFFGKVQRLDIKFGIWNIVIVLPLLGLLFDYIYQKYKKLKKTQKDK